MADGKKGSVGNVILIILVILGVDIIGGYIIAKKLIIPYVYNTGESLEGTENSEIEIEIGKSEMHGFVKDLGSFNFNPANSSGEILSCQLILATDAQGAIDELTTREPQIRDIILTYLSLKSIQELNDVTNREGFKRDLIDRVNSVLTSGKISDLYITDWILTFD
ncbi:flagellar basal body-associated protein FliL [Candidatus Latescibacterota bacterium]